jgi:putative hydrolase of the HAD superfamily
MIQTIAFDADDTLWHSETLYAMTQAEYYALLRPYADEETLKSRLFEIEMHNLRVFGYGVKGFTLSMIETAIDISEGRVTTREIQQILDAGKALLTRPIELLPGVRETLEGLAGKYNLMLITKGDLFHQESRIAASGLGELFSALEIVSEKDVPTYERVFRRYHLDPATFLMVGNSVRSDILPIVALGARAIYIPYEITWQHEMADPHIAAHEGWWELASIAELPAKLAELEAADQ